MPRGRGQGCAAVRLVLLCALASAASPEIARAYDDDAPLPAHDTAVLMRLLDDAHSFRVRARAALALAAHAGDSTITALEAALQDRHPAVRAAVVTSLGRAGTRRSVPALRVAAADSVPEVAAQAKLALREIAARETIVTSAPGRVRNVSAAPASPPSLGQVRYVLVVGDMRNRSLRGGSQLELLLSERVLEQLRELPYVAVLTLDQMTGDIGNEIARRKLPAFRIDGTITNLDMRVVTDEQHMRCEVSLLMMDEPDLTLRSVLKGSASGSEQLRGERRSQLLALAGKTLKSAVRSALGNVHQAVEAAAVRRDLGLPDLAAEASLTQPRSSAREPRSRPLRAR
jgi:hypothetical protein